MTTRASEKFRGCLPQYPPKNLCQILAALAISGIFERFSPGQSGSEVGGPIYINSPPGQLHEAEWARKEKKYCKMYCKYVQNKVCNLTKPGVWQDDSVAATTDNSRQWMVFEAVAGLASKSGPEHLEDLQDLLPRRRKKVLCLHVPQICEFCVPRFSLQCIYTMTSW